MESMLFVPWTFRLLLEEIKRNTAKLAKISFFILESLYVCFLQVYYILFVYRGMDMSV